jgi:hypothetical protein
MGFGNRELHSNETVSVAIARIDDRDDGWGTRSDDRFDETEKPDTLPKAETLTDDQSRDIEGAERNDQPRLRRDQEQRDTNDAQNRVGELFVRPPVRPSHAIDLHLLNGGDASAYVQIDASAVAPHLPYGIFLVCVSYMHKTDWTFTVLEPRSRCRLPPNCEVAVIGIGFGLDLSSYFQQFGEVVNDARSKEDKG